MMFTNSLPYLSLPSFSVVTNDVPADLATHYFFGSLHHLGTWYRPDGEIPAGRLAEHYADLLIHSLSV